MAIKKVSNEFMAKVLNDVAWKALSNTSNKILFHEECIEHFKNYWDWSELSSNTDLKLNYYLIDKFIDIMMMRHSILSTFLKNMLIEYPPTTCKIHIYGIPS